MPSQIKERGGHPDAIDTNHWKMAHQIAAVVYKNVHNNRRKHREGILGMGMYLLHVLLLGLVCSLTVRASDTNAADKQMTTVPTGLLKPSTDGVEMTVLQSASVKAPEAVLSGKSMAKKKFKAGVTTPLKKRSQTKLLASAARKTKKCETRI